MNINALIHQYFGDTDLSPKIELFDKFNHHQVYQRVIKGLMDQPDINMSVLQSLSYCFYEILDNVLTHSRKECGIVLHGYDDNLHHIRLLIADDGIGIHESLTQNPDYANIDEEESLRICINDRVTDGNGMGFGLYSMSRLMQKVGIKMSICSGDYELRLENSSFVTEKTINREGALIYMEIKGDIDIDPNDVVDFKTDICDQFNDEFLNEDNELW